MKMITSGIETFYSQERDWTCGYAALRTILNSTVFKGRELSEEEIIVRGEEVGMGVGPKTSLDLQKVTSVFLNDNPVVTNYDISPESIEKLFSEYLVAIECSILGGHWLVIMDIVKSENVEVVRLYDSYYDNVIDLTLKQLELMWHDKVLLQTDKEFIAVRR